MILMCDMVTTRVTISGLLFWQIFSIRQAQKTAVLLKTISCIAVKSVLWCAIASLTKKQIIENKIKKNKIKLKIKTNLKSKIKMKLKKKKNDEKKFIVDQNCH